MANVEFTKFRNSLKKKEQRDILDKLLKHHSEECKKAIVDEITTDQRHTAILNMCAFAFSESGPLASTGYHFIRVEPLYKFRGEKGNKIFDLVIYHKEQKRAILIECKSSIGDPKNVLDDLQNQISNASDHRTELEDEIGGEIKDIEYVICGIPQDIEEVGKIIKSEPVCLWTADLFHFTLKLYNFSGSNDSSKTSSLIKNRQLHIDQMLREKLYEKIESRGQIEGTKVTPSSHFCRILSRVFVHITQQLLFKSTGEEKRFWLHELKNIVHEELPEIERNDLERISVEIYKFAIKLKIISIEQKTPDGSDIEFGLKMAARNSRVVEQNIDDKYIEEKCNERSPLKAIEDYKQHIKASADSLDYHFSKVDQDTPVNRP